MRKPVGCRYVALLSLIFAAGLLWWLLSARDAEREAFPPEMALGNTICREYLRGGVLEASSIAIFELDGAAAERLQREGPSLLNREKSQSERRRWTWTPWMAIGSDGDALAPGDRASAGSGGSRARMFVAEANISTGNRCSAEIRALDWSDAVVRFEHPASWTLGECDDSCLAQVLFPSSRVAIAATYD